MVVWPSTVTWAMSRVPPPIVTSGPTTQNGPTSTSCARRALGSTLAKGEIFGMLLPQLTTDNGRRTTDIRERVLQRLRIHQHELDIGLAGQLVSNERLAAHMTRAALDPHRDRLQQQLISGNHRVAHLHLIHAQEDRKFTRVLQLLAKQDSP